MNKKINEELSTEIINYYLSEPMTIKKVCDKYKLSQPTVLKILKNTEKYKKSKVYNPQMKEHSFENIDNELSAYFLGLIISDGNVFVTKNKQASISITLDLKDEYILKRFKDFLQTNTSICNDKRGCGQIAVRSDIMAEDLKKYGIIPKKSFHTYLPTISDDMMPHLIRGIFDGDGSILAKVNEKNNKFLHYFSICGTHKLMEDISDYVFKHLNLKQKPNVYDYKNRTLSEIHIQNFEDMKKFGEWIYKDETICLIRKKEIYNVFLDHYFK